VPFLPGGMAFAERCQVISSLAIATPRSIKLRVKRIVPRVRPA